MSTTTINQVDHCCNCPAEIHLDSKVLILHGRWMFCSQDCYHAWLAKPCNRISVNTHLMLMKRMRR